ncbi:hypothetical protein INT43_001257 [Umbelopsis isabellina]|uniref:SP-RING-type domain-containing protein n=1 Tax=Mortierella isabellina TaxID=91625 RepID=A0A8H7UAE3_MORIS|nr:hypothetical protein INT43_001257 [Umbelopsis isabellina]
MSSDARPNRVKFRPVPRSITHHHVQLVCSELPHRNPADVRWWLLHPANLVHFNVKELQAISKILSTNGITSIPPSISRKKPKLIGLIISIVFPGYIANESLEKWVQSLDRHYQFVRTVNRASAEKSDKAYRFAYAQLPRTESITDREELMQAKLTGTSEAMTAELALSVLLPILIKGKLKSQMRIFAYIWRYDCRSFDPDDGITLSLGDKVYNLNYTNKNMLRTGHHHIDITDAIDWKAVFAKSDEHLTAGLILQEICHCINQSFAKDKQKTLDLLHQVYSLLQLGSASALDDLVSIKKAYGDTIGLLGGDCLAHSDSSDNANDVDTCQIGDEVISFRDPLTLKRIHIPSKGTHCTHIGAFDLQTFLEFNEWSIEWKCPFCMDNINGLQDLAVSGQFLQLLDKYPHHDRIIRQADGSFCEPLSSSRKRSPEPEPEAYDPNKYRVIDCGDSEGDERASEEPAPIIKPSSNAGTHPTPVVVEID